MNLEFYKTMFKNLSHFIVGHKIVSAVIAIIVIGGGYFWYASSRNGGTVTKYVVEKATTGTVVASVSGSGQMQALATIDVAPKVSEEVTGISVKVDDTVTAGQLLVTLDTTNEARALAQAQLSLQSAQLSYAKLTEAAATTTLIQDQNAVTQGEQNIISASSTLATDYQSGFDSVSSAFVDIQTVMAGLKTFVAGNDISKQQNDPDAYIGLLPGYLSSVATPYRDAVLASYSAADAAYQQNLADYQAASRSSAPATLDALFSETYNTAQTVSESVKSIKDLLNYVVDNYQTQNNEQLPAVTNTFQTNMSTYTNTVSGDVASLSNAMTSISNDKTSVSNAALSLNAASSSLATLLAGPDPNDVQSSQLSVQQQQLALQTAQTNLDDCYIRAPISGIIASIPAVVGNTVPSPAVTMVGQGQVAEVTLNEIDAAKVQTGDMATVTFDALPNLSLAGQVVELDPVGTVSQGVVDYNAQIALAGSNDQVKPGMSVTANIVTQADQDVITVPNAAITTQGSSDYILEPASSLSDAEIASSSAGGIVLGTSPRLVPVTIGIANDTQTEITSGVQMGDQIIVQTIKSTTGSGGSSAAGGSTLNVSALRTLGGGGGGFGGGAGGGFGGGAAAGARVP
jgi:multidrug efflux pump subunit AcrA (membrane-fusion protein)